MIILSIATLDACVLRLRHAFARIIISNVGHPYYYHKSGYGYQVRFVEDLENIDQDMAASLEWALSEIKKIQGAARSGKPIEKPRWPVLILRTPKVRVSRSTTPIAAQLADVHNITI